MQIEEIQREIQKSTKVPLIFMATHIQQIDQNDNRLNSVQCTN